MPIQIHIPTAAHVRTMPMNIFSHIPSPFSVDGAYVWFQVFSLLFLLATIGTGAGTIITGFISSRRTALALSAQQERAANAEKDLAEVKKRQGPRVLDFDKFKKELAGQPPKRVEILYKKTDDGEAWTLAMFLSGALRSAGWEVSGLPSAIREDDGDSGLENIPVVIRMGVGRGVAVASNAPLSPDVNKWPPSLLALVRALSEGLQSGTGMQTDPTLPEGTFRIIVGPK